MTPFVIQSALLQLCVSVTHLISHVAPRQPFLDGIFFPSVVVICDIPVDLVKGLLLLKSPSCALVSIDTTWSTLAFIRPFFPFVLGLLDGWLLFFLAAANSLVLIILLLALI